MTRAVKFLWRAFFLGVILFAVVIIGVNFGWFGEMPSIEDLQNPSSTIASEVYADDGTPMGKYFLEDRSPVEFKDISPNVINALVATEDERFYEHSGIDGIALLRVLKGLGKDGGGSTITQQLALNMFGGQRASNKIARAKQKLKEWIIAVKLERNFTKDEIITYYLNTVPWGENIYGIRNAARTFFQKEPDRLTVEEAAVLVGMLKANSKYNPRRDPKAAMDRRNTVLDQMVKNNKLGSAEAESMKRKPIELNYKKLDQSTGIAPYFRESVLKDEVKYLLKEKRKPNGDEYNVYKDGLRIYTTINPTMQAYAEESVYKNVAEQQRYIYGSGGNGKLRGGTIWPQTDIERFIKQTDRWRYQKDDGMSDEENRASFNKKVKMKVFAWNTKREKDTTLTPLDSIKYHRSFLQSGFMAMNPQTGDVKAWVGGIDFKTFKLDHARVTTKRQVGSAIKPMLYCQAVEEAGFTPETVCPNTVQMFPGFGPLPAKGKGASGGSVELQVAIARSLNGVAAYLMKQIGPQRFADFLKTCNVQTDVKPYPSNALGACDLSLYEMMWMYTMFPGRGFNTRPSVITRIEDRNGNVLVSSMPQHKEVVSEITSYLMCKMMTGCVKFGTGKGWSSYGVKADVGAKTGTTNDNSDSWFMCYTPDLLVGTWVGCDDRYIKTPGTGGRVAMPACGYFLKKTLGDKSLGYDPEAKFVKPAIDKNDINYDYMQGYNGLVSPDAQGMDQGNGEATDYDDSGNYDEAPIDTSTTTHLKAESQVYKDDSKPDTTRKGSNTDGPKAVMPPKSKKELRQERREERRKNREAGNDK